MAKLMKLKIKSLMFSHLRILLIHFIHNLAFLITLNQIIMLGKLQVILCLFKEKIFIKTHKLKILIK